MVDPIVTDENAGFGRKTGLRVSGASHFSLAPTGFESKHNILTDTNKLWERACSR
jgi:hypothetical protein